MLLAFKISCSCRSPLLPTPTRYGATTALHPDECRRPRFSFCGLFDSFQTCFGMFTSSHGTLSSNRNLFTRDMVYLYPTHYIVQSKQYDKEFLKEGRGAPHHGNTCK